MADLKVRKGYTKHGYPIVWLKKMSHEECMKKMASEGMTPQAPEEFVASEPIKKGEIAGLEFVISADNHGVILDMDGKRTYHSDIKGCAWTIKKFVELKKIRDIGSVNSLEKLLKVMKDTEKEFAKVWGNQ